LTVRVKICGVRTVAEARQAAEAGADAVGLNFYRKSPRYVAPAEAEAIVAALPPFVAAVGLFVDAPADFVRVIADRCRLAALQLHGDMPGHGFGRPVIRAVTLASPADLDRVGHADGDALLLDAQVEGLRGGTGRRIDPSLVLEARRRAGGRAIVLAGGLTPDNVAEAVRLLAPDAVDVASGVESSPGVKDAEKVALFVTAAKGGDATVVGRPLR
jgi:phosphoribosylanthranilate isomerase